MGDVCAQHRRSRGEIYCRGTRDRRCTSGEDERFRIGCVIAVRRIRPKGVGTTGIKAVNIDGEHSFCSYVEDFSKVSPFFDPWVRKLSAYGAPENRLKRTVFRSDLIIANHHNAPLNDGAGSLVRHSPTKRDR